MGLFDPSRARALAILAIATSTLGLLYAPFHAAAYLATASGSESPPIVAWDGPFRDAFPAAFDFAGQEGTYLTFGRVAPFVVLGFVAGLVALRSVLPEPPSRTLRVTYLVLLTTQTIFCAATVVEYYTPFLNQAFIVGFPTFLAGLVAHVVFAIAGLRNRWLPRSFGWSLLAGVALVIPLIALLGHIPLAMSGLFVAWIHIGARLASPTAAPTKTIRTTT